jgi:hypothetical protein
VTIIRKRHAFEGQSLQVMRALKRRQVLLVLVVLPDQSRSLIPASWTDWMPPSQAINEPGDTRECLLAVADLCRARELVDALLKRCPIRSAAQTRQEESHADNVSIPRKPASKTKGRHSSRHKNPH